LAECIEENLIVEPVSRGHGRGVGNGELVLEINSAISVEGKLSAWDLHPQD
jgi:hypothetical protein